MRRGSYVAADRVSDVILVWRWSHQYNQWGKYWACEGNQITVPQVHLKLRLIFYNQLSPSKMFVPLAAGKSAFGTAAMNLGSRLTWWLVFTETLGIGALAPKLRDHNLQIHLVTQATLSTWKMWPKEIGFIPKISKYVSSLPLISTNPPCPKPIQTVSVPD